MMNVSSKTRAWSPAAQESSLKASGDKTIAAGKDPYGGKDIGEVLNEIADPNWVDPKKKIREPKQALDKDAFFKLMLTQMKFQDPTNPLQSHEMAAQLASFTSLEQLSNINTNLEDLKKVQTPQTDYQALNFIGKSISADSSKLVRSKGDKSHELKFNLLGDAANVEITIKDADGNPVRKYTLNNLKKGENNVHWNGLTQENHAARAGDYSFSIEAKTSDGRKIAANTEVKGRITGVNYTSRGPVLMVGEQTVYLKDVQKIEDTNMKAEQGGVPQGSAAGATSVSPQPRLGDEKEASEAAEDPKPKGNLESVAMSGAMMDELKKLEGLER